MTDTLIWISGASAGIGRALAETVPYDDARVVDISRSGGAPGAEHVAADLADPAAWLDVAAHFAEELATFEGERAVFVHNAGTLEPMGFAAEVDGDGYRSQVLLNAAAPQVLGRAFVTAARTFDGDAHLVMLTSGAAQSPYEGWSAYCAGKAAVDMWVQVVAAEETRRGSGTRVLAVAPGVVDTAMQEQIRATDPEQFPRVDKFRGLHERGELTDPAEAARGIWDVLAGDVASGAVVDLRNR